MFTANPESAVLPLDEPPISSGRYCIMRCRSGQVALFAGGAAGVVFHIEHDEKCFGDSLQTEEVEDAGHGFEEIRFEDAKCT